MAQERSSQSECSTVYENKNQIDYGPFKVTVIQGNSVIDVGDSRLQSGVPEVCFILFTESEHKFVASVKPNSVGAFKLGNVAPGRYRLVARLYGLCTANIPLEVGKPSRRRQQKEILVHFKAAGIDTCSYGELVAVSANVRTQ
jgi:hypothetical protein